MNTAMAYSAAVTKLPGRWVGGPGTKRSKTSVVLFLVTATDGRRHYAHPHQYCSPKYA